MSETPYEQFVKRNGGGPAFAREAGMVVSISRAVLANRMFVAAAAHDDAADGYRHHNRGRLAAQRAALAEQIRAEARAIRAGARLELTD